jgi:hypothetical protein
MMHAQAVAVTVRMVIERNLDSVLVTSRHWHRSDKTRACLACRWFHSCQPRVVQPDVDVSPGVCGARAWSHTPQMPLMAAEAADAPSLLSVWFQIRIGERGCMSDEVAIAWHQRVLASAGRPLWTLPMHLVPLHLSLQLCIGHEALVISFTYPCRAARRNVLRKHHPNLRLPPCQNQQRSLSDI